MLGQLVDHLWQSSLYAAGVAMLAVLLRRVDARYRYWLWFSATVKFLVPFAWLAEIGRRLGDLGLPHLPAEAARQALPAVRAIEIGSAPATGLRLLHQSWDQPLMAIWAMGLMAILLLWGLNWNRLRRIARDAVEVPGMTDIPVRSSSSSLEPGVIGIVKPIVLFPRAVLEHLVQAELAALLEHEKAHLRRRDNLLSAVQMVAEGMFWFYPLVWWLGARLIQERETACDQHVLAAGHDPRTYAESILKVCRLCLGSPMACAAGVSGSNLKRRIEKIVGPQTALPLHSWQKSVLALAAAAMLLGPVGAGLMTLPASKVLTHIARQGTSLLQHVVELNDPKPMPVPARRHGRRIGMRFVRLALGRDIQLNDLLPLATSPPMLPEAQKTAGSPPEIVNPNSGPPRRLFRGDKSANEGRVQTVMFGDPTGNGDPDAITCRAPQQLPGSRMMGPKICLPNARWAALAGRGLHYSAAGQILATQMESQPLDEGVRMVYVNCRDVARCADATWVLGLR